MNPLNLMSNSKLFSTPFKILLLVLIGLLVFFGIQSYMLWMELQQTKEMLNSN